MTRLLPYRRFSIDTPLSPDEAIARLREVVEPVKWLRSSRDHAVFEGAVTNDTFVIERILKGRNSFRPVVSGRVESVPGNGARVTGHMRLALPTIVFVILWFSGVTWACILTARGIIQRQIGAPGLIPFGLLLFGIALTYGGFLSEAHRTARALDRVVGGTRTELR